MIDLPSAASTAGVNVKLVSVNGGRRGRWEIDFVFYRLSVIGKLQVRAINAVKFPNHSQEICLSTKQVSDNNSRALPQPLPAEMFAGENALGFDQLFVKLVERQLRRQYCVLDIKQAVISRGETARFSVPCFGTGVRRVDADVHDLGNFQTPIAHDFKAFTVPRWIGDDVYRHRDVQRPSVL